jgi:hypothetical protein
LVSRRQLLKISALAVNRPALDMPIIEIADAKHRNKQLTDEARDSYLPGAQEAT